MTTPLLDANETQLKWKAADQRNTTNYENQQIQDSISPDAGSLDTNSFYNRLNTIRQDSASATAGAIASDQTKKQREAAVKAAELAKTQALAQQQAAGAMASWQGGNTGQVQNGSTGGEWGSGGAQGMANVLRAAGFPESAIPTMMAIGKAESGWNPSAFNGSNSNGSTDSGLFQINTVHRNESWYPTNLSDPLQSAKAAYALYQRSGGSYKDWSVYNSGTYKQYLQAAPSIQQANLQPYAASTGGSTGLRNTIVSTAMNYIGLPYVYGGNSLSKGVDCSGLVQQIYYKLGLPMPNRTAATQSAWGTNNVNGARTSIANLRPGDLVAWNPKQGQNYVGHIAIYAGNGEIIEAPYTGASVRRRKLGNENVFGVALNFLGN